MVLRKKSSKKKQRDDRNQTRKIFTTKIKEYTDFPNFFHQSTNGSPQLINDENEYN